MSRETKVGLIVACSFLVLVGIVVFSKWQNGDDPSNQPDLKLASISPTPEKKEVKPSETPKQAEPPTTLPALPTQKPGTPIVQSDAQVPATSTAAPKTPEEWLKHNIEQAKDKTKEAVLLFPAPGPQQDSKDIANPLTLPANLPGNQENKLPPNIFEKPPEAIVMDEGKKNDGQANTLPTFPPVAQTQNETPVFPPIAPVKKDESPAFPPVDSPKKETALVFPPLAPLKKDNEPTFPPITTAGPGSSIPMFPPQQKDAVLSPPNTLTLPADFKKDAAIQPLTNREQPVFPGSPKDDVLTTQPLPDVKPLPKKDTLTPAPLIITANDVTKPSIGTPSVLPDAPARTIPPIGPPELPSTPIITTNPGNNLPTIGIGGIKPLPTPVEHKLDITESRPGETSFGQLSARLYGTDKYADALHAYNRSHGGNANLNPTIGLGQKLMYPTSPEVLVREYPNLVRTVTPPTIPSAPSGPAVKLVPPSMTPTPPAIAAVSNPPAGQGRSYVVQSPNGERIRDIAQRALGNADRWTEIYRINQSLNLQPQFPLPVGTRLALPSN